MSGITFVSPSWEAIPGKMKCTVFVVIRLLALREVKPYVAMKISLIIKFAGTFFSSRIDETKSNKHIASEKQCTLSFALWNNNSKGALPHSNWLRRICSSEQKPTHDRNKQINILICVWRSGHCYWYGDHSKSRWLQNGVELRQNPTCDRDLTEKFNADNRHQIQKLSMLFNRAKLSSLLIPPNFMNMNNTISQPSLVDSGTPYCVIGKYQLSAVASIVMPDWTGHMESIPSPSLYCQYWQYKFSQQASSPLKSLELWW